MTIRTRMFSFLFVVAISAMIAPVTAYATEDSPGGPVDGSEGGDADGDGFECVAKGGVIYCRRVLK